MPTATAKRKIDILVLSDIHLGTFGCRAKELLQYLSTIQPKVVILNGDIIDIWQFSKRYWPKSHMKVIKHLFTWISNGTKTYYITGNHDEMLRKFADTQIGSLHIVNKLVLELDDKKKAWFFHGDVVDVTMQHSKWLAKLGAVGYDTLILLNSFVNFISDKILKKGKLSFSKKIKNRVKSAIQFIHDFEKTSAEIGIMNRYDYVICGHIHQPAMKVITTDQGSITYLNSGDWVENLTALEYRNGQWAIQYFSDTDYAPHPESTEVDLTAWSHTDLFDHLLDEFKWMKA